MKQRKRTRAREIAMQLLYQHDICARAAAVAAEEGAGGGGEGSIPPELAGAISDGMPDEAAIESQLATMTDDPEVRRFAHALYEGAVDSLETSDGLIGEVAEHWKIERIAAIDRAILRLAIFELAEMEDVPPKVVLNEAIELAKRYSTAESGRFINGLLDRMLFLRDSNELGRERAGGATDRAPGEGP